MWFAYSTAFIWFRFRNFCSLGLGVHSLDHCRDNVFSGAGHLSIASWDGIWLFQLHSWLHVPRDIAEATSRPLQAAGQAFILLKLNVALVRFLLFIFQGDIAKMLCCNVAVRQVHNRWQILCTIEVLWFERIRSIFCWHSWFLNPETIWRSISTVSQNEINDVIELLDSSDSTVPESFRRSAGRWQLGQCNWGRRIVA